MAKFNVVKCFSCHMFQVDQAKKADKWKCKVCGEKQSFVKVFFESEQAKDCRLAVQELNMKKASEPSVVIQDSPPKVPIKAVPKPSGPSKWSRFISEGDVEESRDFTDNAILKKSKAPADSLFSMLDKGIGRPAPLTKQKPISNTKTTRRPYTTAIPEQIVPSPPKVFNSLSNDPETLKKPRLEASSYRAHITNPAIRQSNTKTFQIDLGDSSISKPTISNPSGISKWSKFAEQKSPEEESQDEGVSLW